MGKLFSFRNMDCKLVVLGSLLAIAQSVPLNGFDASPTRIFGGQDARKGEFPHLVTLTWILPPIAKIDNICGGAIINESWILTTANCLIMVPGTGGSLLVKAGKHRLVVPERDEQVVVVKKRIQHENFEWHSDEALFNNNIALLKLEKPLRLNENVAAIKLPQANSDVTGDVTIAGWGITSDTEEMVFPKVLQKVNATLSDMRECQDAYEKEVPNMPMVSADNNFCTTYPSKQSACFGDMGVPVITNELGKPRELVGLISWTIHPNCSVLNLPNVHVKVSSYVKWIQTTMANEMSH